MFHLIAPSEAVRTTWLAGIKDVFANVGKKATDARDSKERKSLARQGSLPPQPSPTPSAADVVVPAPVPVPGPDSELTADSAKKLQLEIAIPADAADSEKFTPRPDPVNGDAVAPADRPSALDAPGSSLLSPTAAAAVATLHHDEAVVKSKTSLLEVRPSLHCICRHQPHSCAEGVCVV